MNVRLSSSRENSPFAVSVLSLWLLCGLCVKSS